jgi:adenylyltransferase/sulfurtransferase
MSKDVYYSKQIALPQIGVQGQDLLKEARVLVIGAGGLGVPLLQILASAGVGYIGIADFDKVSLSNLHRQYIYKHQDLGKFKAHLAKQYIQDLNPFIEIESHCTVVEQDNVLALIEPYHIVVDCTDNFTARYLINDACVCSNKILVYGSVFQFEGNVTVFNLFKDSPTLRCLFPQNQDSIPTCESAGVLATTTTITAAYMATEVIKIILGLPAILDSKLLIINSLDATNSIFTYKPIAKNRELSKLTFKNNSKSFTISGEKLKEILISNLPIQLVDVRTEQEHQFCNLGGILLPLDDLEDQYQILDKSKTTILYCHHGIRSEYALKFLLSRGFENIKYLEGGIHEYAIYIDPSIPVY